MKFLPLILIAGLTGLSLPSTAAASPEKGLEIATELDKRDTGFKDSTSTMVMVLSDQHGQSTQRAIRNRTLEGSSEGDLSLVIF